MNAKVSEGVISCIDNEVGDGDEGAWRCALFEEFRIDRRARRVRLGDLFLLVVVSLIDMHMRHELHVNYLGWRW